MGVLTTLGTGAGAAGLGGSGAFELSSSCGSTFLTTRRTTLTTFLREKPWSSVSSGWLALTDLPVPLSVPLGLLSPLSNVSELLGALAVSGLLKRSGILGSSLLLSDMGLVLLGEGLLTRSLLCGCDCV